MTTLCAHGYVLLQDSCPSCDHYSETPHASEPVTFFYTRYGETRRRRYVRCRHCAQIDGARVHRVKT